MSNHPEGSPAKRNHVKILVRLVLCLLWLSGFLLPLHETFARDQGKISEPTKEEILIQILEVTGTKEQMANITSNVSAYIDAVASTSNIPFSPELKKVMQNIVEEELNSIKDDIFAMVIEIYDQSYSKEELADLLAFYQSPTRAMVLEKQPIIQNQIAKRSGELMGVMIPRMNAKLHARLLGIEQAKDPET